MNRAEYDAYLAIRNAEPVVRGEEFESPKEGGPMRLLCRGWHANGGPNLRVWLDLDGQIGVQHNDGDIVFKGEWPASALRPGKRAYVEETDLMFALVMADRDAALTFTTWRTA